MRTRSSLYLLGHLLDPVAHCGARARLHISAMQRFALAVFLVLVGVAPTQAQSWTLAPTFSFGYGWSYGEYDHLGSQRAPFELCRAGGPTTNCIVGHVPRVAAYGGLGVALVDTVTSRFAATLTADLTLGGTRRIDQPSRSAGAVTTVDDDGDLHFHTAKLELAYRVASTGRLLVGAARRGYLGAGVRLGYRMQVAGTQGETVLDRSVNPDASPDDFVRRLPQGFTAEALLEGGVALGRSRPISFGVVVGAGRPRFRAEVVMSFPIAIAAQ